MVARASASTVGSRQLIKPGPQSNGEISLNFYSQCSVEADLMSLSHETSEIWMSVHLQDTIGSDKQFSQFVAASEFYFLFFFLTSLLMYNLYTTKFTHCKFIHPMISSRLTKLNDHHIQILFFLKSVCCSFYFTYEWHVEPQFPKPHFLHWKFRVLTFDFQNTPSANSLEPFFRQSCYPYLAPGSH